MLCGVVDVAEDEVRGVNVNSVVRRSRELKPAEKYARRAYGAGR